MNKAFALQTTHGPNARHTWRSLRATATMLFLLLTAGLNAAVAANVLTDPGFELGGAVWQTNTWGAGAGQLDTVTVHSGLNSWKWNGAGALPDAWQGGRQLNVPVSDAKFYQFSAWVNVPTADNGANKFGWAWRSNRGAGGQDTGYTVITAPGWTLVKNPIIQPAAGATMWGYVGFHTLNYGGQIPFFLDDVAVEELDALILNGRVVDSGGAGVDGATVSAASADYSTPATTTAGGGYYTLSVPPGTYTVAASTPGFKGGTVTVVSASPTTASNIVLAVDPDYDADLIFSAYSTSIPAAGAWPAASPASLMLTRIGAPTTEMIGGVQWEKNVADGPGWRVGSENTAAIPSTGATAIAVVKMAAARTGSNNWDSVIDVFYDRLVLGVRNDTGLVNVRCNGSLVFAPVGTELAEGQKAVLALVVQPDGTYVVYVNGTQIMTGIGGNATNPPEMTALTPGAAGHEHYINVGRNDPDGWTTFNGNIGDVFLYSTAISDTKRAALEAKLKTKFAIEATIYTIAASVSGTGGTITPSGPAIGVPSGTDKIFTITPQDAYYAIKSVVVDGVDQGPIASYTFTNVTANGHTIVASFIALPAQVVSGRVTTGTDGIIGATVYFKSSANASVSPNFTTSTTNYDGQYNVRLLLGTWYVAAGAPGYNTSADVPLIATGAPATIDFALTAQVSTMQPMLVSKGAGTERIDAVTAGFTFTTGPNAIDVTQLGFVDWEGDGLLFDHAVGIWQGVDLLTSASVPAGTAGPKVGNFRYAAANPVITLAPNTTYKIAADTAGGDKWPQAAPNPGFSAPDFSGIAGVSALYADGPFVEPTIAFGVAGDVFAAANLIGKMAVPPTVKVSGVVKDAYGVGINNAVVQIGVGGPATTTDANGKYKMFDVPIGAAEELYADAVGYADNIGTINTSTAATVPVVKDITLTGKVETGVIVNGGFEGGLAPWTHDGTPQVGVTTNDKYSGAYAGYWKSTVAVWYDGYLRYRLPVVPGSTYNIYFKVKTSAAVGQCGFDWLNAAGDGLGWSGYAGGLSPGSNWMYTTVPGKWEQVLNYRTWDNATQMVGLRMTPPADATAIQIIAGLGATAVGQILYVDDVVIDRIGPDSAAGPFTTLDVVESLRWAGGLATVPQNYLTRYDVVPGGGITLADALRIARKVAGLDTNP